VACQDSLLPVGLLLTVLLGLQTYPSGSLFPLHSSPRGIPLLSGSKVSAKEMGKVSTSFGFLPVKVMSCTLSMSPVTGFNEY